MPSVPQYTGNIAEQGFQAPRVGAVAPDVPEASLGADSRVPRAVEALNKTTIDIYEAEKRKADLTADQETAAILAAQETLIMHGPKERPAEGLLNLRGKTVGMAQDLAADRWAKIVRDLEKNAGNETQRAALRARADQQWASMDRQLAAHVAQETQRYAVETHAASLKNNVELGIANYADPARVAEARRSIDAAMYSLGNVVKMSPEELAKKATEAHTELNLGVIRRMINNGMIDAARQYYFDVLKSEPQPKENGEPTVQYIAGDQRGQIEALLGEAGLSQKAMELTNKLIQQFPDTGAEGEAKAREWLTANVTDVKMVDEVKRRLGTEYAEMRQSKKMSEDKNYMDAFNFLEGKRQLPEPGNPLWDNLNGEQKKSLQDVHWTMQGRRVAKDDVQVWTKFLGMSPAKLARYTQSQLIAEAYPKLTDSTFGQLLNHWNSAREAMARDQRAGSKGAKAGAAWKSMMTDKDMIFRTLQSGNVNGISEKDTLEGLHKDAPKAEAFNSFYMKADQAFQSYYNQTGKNPDDSTKQQILDRMLRDKAFVPGKHFWNKDTEVPEAALNKGQRARAYVPANRMDEKAKQEIRQFFDSRGLQASDADLGRAYFAMRSGDAAALESVLRKAKTKPKR